MKKIFNVSLILIILLSLISPFTFSKDQNQNDETVKQAVKTEEEKELKKTCDTENCCSKKVIILKKCGEKTDCHLKDVDLEECIKQIKCCPKIKAAIDSCDQKECCMKIILNDSTISIQE